MTPRRALIAALLMVGCAVPAAAPAGTPSAPVAGDPAAVRTKASVRNATAPRAPAPANASRFAAKPGGPVSATAPNRSGASTRTLEDIHIEGEIPVPQVLFITTRDQRRFVGFQHHRYLRTSRKIGEDTAVPSRIIVTGAATLPERSHSDE